MFRFALGTFAAFLAAFFAVHLAFKDNAPVIRQQTSSDRTKALVPQPPKMSRADRTRLELDWERQKFERKMRDAQSDLNSASLRLKHDLKRIDQKYEADSQLNHLKWQLNSNRR
jgi:hypothetical protein